MIEYDCLIVGAGLFGACFAQQMHENGKKCLVIDKRDHIAGNAFSKVISGIEVHQYGPHIFHTDLDDVWQYVNRFAKFNHFRYEPLAKYKGKIYHLPFNMNTFHEMWGIETPEQATEIISKQQKEIVNEPSNLEEKAISLVGRDIYEKLIKGYTEKQWGCSCKELSADIITRLPVRMRYDNNYFNHPFQGIPICGYTNMVSRMLDGIEVRLNSDFFANREGYKKIAKCIVYTGPLDQYFDYKFGSLGYRSLEFFTEELPISNFQGVAGVNYTDADVPYTRIVEHKHFTFGTQENTVITKEYPLEWKAGREPYYPINDEKNNALYAQYAALCQNEKNVIFGGRLAEYKYYDMDKVIASALKLAKKQLEKKD